MRRYVLIVEILTSILSTAKQIKDHIINQVWIVAVSKKQILSSSTTCERLIVPRVKLVINRTRLYLPSQITKHLKVEPSWKNSIRRPVHLTSIAITSQWQTNSPLEDGILLIVAKPREDETTASIRAHFGVIEIRLQSEAAMHIKVAKDQETAKNTKGEADQLTAAGYRLHKPDPANFFPPELRCEMLLGDEQRFLLGTRHLEKDPGSEELVWCNESPSRIVRELFGD